MSGATKLMTAGGGGVVLTPATSIASDVTVQVPSANATLITTASTFAGTGPAFSAYPSAGVSCSNGAWTKLPYDTEQFDTNSNYDAANSRFTPTVAGYYQINASMTYVGAAAPGSNSPIGIWKNGSWYATGSGGSTGGCYLSVTALIPMNGTTDYLEVYAYQNSGSTLTSGASGVYQFSGALVRAS